MCKAGIEVAIEWKYLPPRPRRGSPACVNPSPTAMICRSGGVILGRMRQPVNMSHFACISETPERPRPCRLSIADCLRPCKLSRYARLHPGRAHIVPTHTFAQRVRIYSPTHTNTPTPIYTNNAPILAPYAPIHAHIHPQRVT